VLCDHRLVPAVKHPVFDPPPHNTTIWRYSDLAKFVLLFAPRTLWFARADRLGDPHEGALPLRNVRARDSFIAEAELRAGTAWQMGQGLASPEEATLVTVKSTFINCWNISPDENHLLWAYYGKGVAIKSTYGSLRRSIQTNDPVYIGKVRYID